MQNINRIVIAIAAVLLSTVLFLQGNTIMMTGTLMTFIAGASLKILAVVGTISLVVTCFKQLNLRKLVIEIIGLCVITVVATIAAFLLHVGLNWGGFFGGAFVLAGAAVLSSLLWAFTHEMWVTVKGLW